MVLSKLLSRISDLNLELVLKEVLKDEEVIKLIKRLNKEQLSLGENSKGELLGTYSELTEDIARNYQFYDAPKPNKPKIAGEPYNFDWTGEFFESIEVLESNLGVIIDGGRNLRDGFNFPEKYGEDVFGLSDENFKIVEEFIIGKSIEYIKNYIFS